MEIITNTVEFQLDKDTAAALGKFDGIHIGHRRLLQEILSRKAQGLAACVFTFEPSPQIFFGGSDGKVLSTRDEKRAVFEKLGVDILIEFPLNKDTAGMEPETFAREILSKRMHVKYLAAGNDLSFGAKGAGNAQLLHDMASELGFETETIDKVYLDDVQVSSTRLRECVERGDMDLAKRLLGTPYMISGKVVGGNRIGRTIGFPTINVVPEKCKLIPPCGVYFSEVLWNGKMYPAISNVGYKPTVTEERRLGVETYLYDFDQMIYDEDVEVYLCKFYREERKFMNLEALREQLDLDVETGRLYFEVKS